MFVSVFDSCVFDVVIFVFFTRVTEKTRRRKTELLTRFKLDIYSGNWLLVTGS